MWLSGMEDQITSACVLCCDYPELTCLSRFLWNPHAVHPTHAVNFFTLPKYKSSFFLRDISFKQSHAHSDKPNNCPHIYARLSNSLTHSTDSCALFGASCCRRRPRFLPRLVGQVSSWIRRGTVYAGVVWNGVKAYVCVCVCVCVNESEQVCLCLLSRMYVCGKE